MQNQKPETDAADFANPKSQGPQQLLIFAFNCKHKICSINKKVPKKRQKTKEREPKIDQNFEPLSNGGFAYKVSAISDKQRKYTKYYE